MSDTEVAGPATTDVPAADVARRYVRLGLRLGRHVDGLVDAWYGDPQLAADVDAERPVPPDDLADEARRLRAALDDLAAGGAREIEPDRRRFLDAQLVALECIAERVAGHDLPFTEEVARYFDVEIELGSTERYAEVHAEIGDVVGGSGPLGDRVDAFYERNQIPPDRLLGCVHTVAEGLRARVGPRFGLPDGERVEFSVVDDVPWNAFNRYRGGFRSTVELNRECGRTVAALPVIVTHEAYAGHHTEHCLKEQHLVRDLGREEHTIALVNTPQSLMAEGLAELSVDIALGPGWGAWTEDALVANGVHVDGAAVERMLVLVQRLMPVRQDALLMLHEAGADPSDVVEYLRRWLLLPADRAEHMVRFLLDPLWRAYSVTYVEGARLVRAWLGAADGPSDAGGSHGDDAARSRDRSARFERLLREPLLPGDLRR